MSTLLLDDLRITPKKIDQRIREHRDYIIRNKLDPYEISEIKKLFSHALYVHNEQRDLMIDFITKTQDFPDRDSFCVYVVKTFLEGVKTTGGYDETASFWKKLGDIDFYSIQGLEGRFIAFVKEIPIMVSVIRVNSQLEDSDNIPPVLEGCNLLVEVPDVASIF